MQNDNKDFHPVTGNTDAEFTPDQQFRLQQQQMDTFLHLGSGVINIVRDLVEVQGIRNRGRIQLEVMKSQRKNMLIELEAFKVKHSSGRETFKDHSELMLIVLNKLQEQLREQNLSDEVKVNVIDLYKTVFIEMMKKHEQ